MKTKTEILYYLDSDSHILVEIKFYKKGEVDKSKMYYWILYDKDSQEFETLDFVSMSDNERTFKQGKLYLHLIYNSAILMLNNEQISFNLIKQGKDTNYKLIQIICEDLAKKEGV